MPTDLEAATVARKRKAQALPPIEITVLLVCAIIALVCCWSLTKAFQKQQSNCLDDFKKQGLRRACEGKRGCEREGFRRANPGSLAIFAAIRRAFCLSRLAWPGERRLFLPQCCNGNNRPTCHMVNCSAYDEGMLGCNYGYKDSARHR